MLWTTPPSRPQHIILFCPPLFYSLIPKIIPYYYCNYSFLSETFSYKNNYVHIVYNYWSPCLLYWTISVAATKSCRELCCCSSNAFLSKENTHSAAAEGCTKNTYCAADDQCGRSSWWSFHHFRVLVWTLNHDWANLTPLFSNYSFFLSAPIIRKEIPE